LLAGMQPNAGKLDGAGDRLLLHRHRPQQLDRRKSEARFFNKLRTYRGSKPCTFVHKLLQEGITR
jgi:hypothetical protein